MVEALDAFDEPQLLSILTAKKSNGKSSRSLITGLALNLPYNLVQKRKPKRRASSGAAAIRVDTRNHVATNADES